MNYDRSKWSNWYSFDFCQVKLRFILYIVKLVHIHKKLYVIFLDFVPVNKTRKKKEDNYIFSVIVTDRGYSN